MDGIANGKEVNLVMQNWLRKGPNPEQSTKDPKEWGLEKQEFRLQNGVDIIQLNDYGSLTYIGYFSDQPEKEGSITVHFPKGQVNGYFDIRKHSNKDWDHLIGQAVFPIIDAKGEHIQTAYPVESMKKRC